VRRAFQRLPFTLCTISTKIVVSSWGLAMVLRAPLTMQLAAVRKVAT